MTLALPFILGLAVTMSILPLLGRLATTLRVVDVPGGRKAHGAPIPRIGGVAMAIGAIAALSSLDGGPSPAVGAVLAGAGVLVVFGVADDRFDLDYRLKFLGQALAVAIPVFVGDIQFHSVTWIERIAVPAPLGVAVTWVFLVGVTNAVNLADGLDGLAGGMAFLCLCALAWLASVAGDLPALVLSLGLAGATLGFLRFNTHPATVFMGDAGSQLLGYSIGVLSLLVTQCSPTPVSAALPLLLVGMPVLDTLQVMLHRLAAGGSPFRADRRHLHHRLLGLGFAHHEAVTILYGLQALLFLAAYAERFDPDPVLIASYGGFALAVLAALGIAERRGWRVRAAHAHAQHPWLTRLIGGAYASGRLRRAATVVVAGGLACYAALALYEVGIVPPDLGVAVALLGMVVLALLAARRDQPLSALDKAVLYAIVAAFVFCDMQAAAAGHAVTHAKWALVVGVAVATVVALRADGVRRFVVTPLDLLVLFLALIVPNLPGFSALPAATAAGVAQVVGLNYGLEVILSVGAGRPALVRGAALLATAALATRFAMAFG
jgi:UDP-GlcNAc:undecaprenyl-phosphate GlcNAc-1-phosphate transferase